MKRPHRRSFLLVAELSKKRIAKVMEGPDEETLPKGEAASVVESAILRELKELHQRFPLPEFDVIVTRAEDLKAVQHAFPEFSGWNDVLPEHIAA
jgi:hypothetical protein